MNRANTVMLLALLTALLLWTGHALAGRTGLAIALVVALVLNFESYWFSDKIVLRMYGSQAIQEEDAARLFTIVRQLATRAEIPMPRGLSHSRGCAECICDGAKPAACGIGPYRGSPADAGPDRTCRSDRA